MDQRAGFQSERLSGSLQAKTRAAQIAAIVRFTPLTMLVNAISAALVAFVVWPTANGIILTMWMVGVTAIVALTSRAWWRSLRRSSGHAASARAIRRAALYGATLGALWGFVPAAWLPSANEGGVIIIVAVVTGMMCAGGFALSTVRSAANAYVTMVMAGTLIGLLSANFSYRIVLLALLCVYAAVLFQSIWSNWKLFQDRFLAEAIATERGQVIELLLAEFEQNG